MIFLNKTDLIETRKKMVDHLAGLKRVIIAFSGGVDSTVVAALTHEAIGEDALAVIIDSPLLPRRELVEAQEVAEEIGIRCEIIHFNELTIDNIRNNPRDRCYKCKKARYTVLIEYAEQGGYDVVLEGTNASDLNEYRPGLAASDELCVKKPLLLFGLSKQDTRDMAEFLGLSNALKPSNSCLAARVPYGEVLDVERLQRIEKCEDIIREETGASVIRARDHGDLLRIELEVHERKKTFSEQTMDRLYNRINCLGYKFVVLDLKGYSFGSYDT